MDFPKKIFNPKINDVEIGVGDIHLFSEEEIEDAQKGYRIDGDGNKIKDWVGDNYFVIGYDSCCGDPIIADLSDDKLPIYSMFHDDWSTLGKISDDFEQFISILEKINNTDLKDESKKDELIKYIKSILPEDGADYWETSIQGAYEFLNDID